MSEARVTQGARLRPPAASVSRRRPWLAPTTAAIIATTLLALALRLYQLSRPGFLLGITEYDDGTDLGSAIRLVHGLVPYRDFIMVQPPGITVLMAPVALATKGMSTVTTMAVGRVLTALASVAAVTVAGLVVRHRGLLATLVTCGVLAVYPDTILAAKTVLLEPWLVLLCLLGVAAVFDGDHLAGRRRMIWGGLAFGLAGAVKVWAILPVLVILALTARKPRQALAFAAGLVAGFGVVVLPFFLAAPATFYRSVIIAQLVRSDVPVPVGYRLQQMLGLVHVSQLATSALTLISVAVLAGIAGTVAAGWSLTHRPPPALDTFALAAFVLVIAAFLWPADFYYHYAAFLAPFLALVIALPTARLLAAQGATEHRGGWGPRARGSAVPAAILVLAVLTVLQAGAESHTATVVPLSEIAATQRLIPPSACVLSDQVSNTIALDRFNSPVRGCSVMVDGVGADYTLSGGQNGLTGAGDSPAVRQLWMSAFRSAQYVWLTGGSQEARRIPWTPELRNYFLSHFSTVSVGINTLYARRGVPGH